MATAAEVFRDYVTDGVPSSGAKKPKKSEIRGLLKGYEDIISAFLSSGGLIYSSLAALNADLAHDANSMAWVVGDATAANNGIYRKVGASGTGSWVRVADLPYSFIVASDVGDGTPDAIVATSSLPVSGSALVLLNIYETNTGSPVTVAFNGSSPLTIKTNSGNDVAAGGLVSGMLVMGRVSGTTFRIVTDQVSTAIVAAAEAAQALTEDARDETLAAISAHLTYSLLPLFGAVGNGSINADGTGSGTGTDDSAAIQLAINTLPADAVIDGLGKTYRVNSQIQLKSGQKLRNMKIDASGLPAGARLFQALGSLGTASLLSANAAAFASSVTVASVDGLANGDLIWISSTSQFYTQGTPGLYGEFARVKSIVGTTLTLFDQLLLTYNTAAAAKVQKVNPAKDVTLENIIACGDGSTNTMMAECWYGENFNVINCHGTYFFERNIQIRKVYGGCVRGGSYKYTKNTGLGYGVAINDGSQGVTVSEVTFEDMRHGVTVGGVDGINRAIKAHHNLCLSMTDAGLDSHPNAYDVDFSHNTVHCSPLNTGTGIVGQCVAFKAIGNHVYGKCVYAIWYQQYTTIAGTCIIADNEIMGDGTGTYAVAVETHTDASGGILGATISNNRARGFVSFGRVYAIGSNINRLDVIGNSVTDPNGCTGVPLLVRAAPSRTLSMGAISDNVFQSNGAAQGVYLLADSGGSVTLIRVGGNTIRGTTGTGILGTGTDYILTDSNIIFGHTTKVTVAGANSVLGTNL